METVKLIPMAAILKRDNHQKPHHYCFQSRLCKSQNAKKHSGLVLLNINKFMIGLLEDGCNRKYNHDKVIWRDLICVFRSMLLSMGFGFFCKSNFPASGTATVT